MGLTDMRGMPVSTTNRESLDRYEEAEELFLSYFADPLAIIEGAVSDDPGFVMGHCFRAGLMVAGSEKAALEPLEESVRAGEALWDDANDRERGHIAAARAWLDGDLATAIRLYGDILHDYPRDTLAIQVAHIGDFLLGQSTMLRDRIARVLPQWEETVPGYGYLLGMHAFGLEETNDFDAAEAAGRRAVELNPRDPWAIHAVAHVMEMQGRLADGIDWMDQRTDNGRREHVRLSKLVASRPCFTSISVKPTGSLELYDIQIHPQSTEVALELLDASSLLWRLHLRGVEVGNSWDDLADTWEAIPEGGFYAFNDLHAMMAYTATGRAAAANRLLEQVEGRRAWHQHQRVDESGSRLAVVSSTGCLFR